MNYENLHYLISMLIRPFSNTSRRKLMLFSLIVSVHSDSSFPTNCHLIGEAVKKFEESDWWIGFSLNKHGFHQHLLKNIKMKCFRNITISFLDKIYDAQITCYHYFTQSVLDNLFALYYSDSTRQRPSL